MKNLKFLICVILCINTPKLYGQSTASPKEVSNAEKFSEKSGSLIQKEFIDIGSIKKCKVQITRFIDLINNQNTNAVRFEYRSIGSYSNDDKIAILDSDEIDGLIKSLKIIQEKILPTQSQNYTEISFKSRSGFEAGCFSKKENWDLYLKLERGDSNSYVFLSKEDLPNLLSLLETAKSKL